jgi:hypothetical protein
VKYEEGDLADLLHVSHRPSAARNNALEEAAKIAEHFPTHETMYGDSCGCGKSIAESIRALKDPS